MSAAPDLASIRTGFAQPTFDSQRVFRAALQVLSRPGEVGEIGIPVDFPGGLHAAAGATLLALLDQDTRLWISPSFSPEVARYLGFHTGCALVADAASADFALVAHAADLPPLSTFPHGDTEFPDRSVTIILQVASLNSGQRWILGGPGINGSTTVAVDGMPEGFVAAWNAQRRLFPCGVDLFLVAGQLLLGLPRTTRIET